MLNVHVPSTAVLVTQLIAYVCVCIPQDVPAVSVLRQAGAYTCRLSASKHAKLQHDCVDPHLHMYKVWFYLRSSYIPRQSCEILQPLSKHAFQVGCPLSPPPCLRDRKTVHIYAI